MNEGSCVGLDVHARSVVAGVIDLESGEVRSVRVPPGSEATVAWLKTLSAPVRVAYEAGPTGYGLARACEGRGSAALSRRRRRSGRPPIGSRRTAVTLSGWRGCYDLARSRRCGCLAVPRDELRRSEPVSCSSCGGFIWARCRRRRLGHRSLLRRCAAESAGGRPSSTLRSRRGTRPHAPSDERGAPVWQAPPRRWRSAP